MNDKVHRHLWEENWTFYENRDRFSGLQCVDCKRVIHPAELSDIINSLEELRDTYTSSMIPTQETPK